MVRKLSVFGTVLTSTALLAIAPETGAAAPFVVLQAESFCATPFIGDLATWGIPKMTKLLMLGGAGVFAWGIFGAPAEGRGRLSLRHALLIGLVMFFVGFQWVPTWEYIGGIFGEGSIDAVTCGM